MNAAEAIDALKKLLLHCAFNGELSKDNTRNGKLTVDNVCNEKLITGKGQ